MSQDTTDNRLAPSESIKQEHIHKAVWNTCDTFQGTVAPSIDKNYMLTMLFVKHLLDVWQHHYDAYVREYGDVPEMIKTLMQNERFVLPPTANVYALYEARHG